VKPHLILAYFAVACGGEQLTEGFDEPFRVSGAQFVKGELPGFVPLSSDDIKAGKQPKKPYSTSPEVAGRLLDSRSADLGVSGRTSTDGYAVGLQLRGMGTGYWLLPVGSPDPINDNQLAWNARIDFLGVEPGLQHLRVAAFDKDGKSGTQTAAELCIRSPIPDNLNACEPTLEPPQLVVSLAWESAGDLDLAVVTPAGNTIDYSHPTNTADPNNRARFTGDGGTGCSPIGARRENITWQEKPPKGTYLVYANLHDACGDGGTPFVVSIHERKQKGKTFDQVESYRTASEILAVQANGGSQLGLFITEFTVK
jgi:hypothetical protein